MSNCVCGQGHHSLFVDGCQGLVGVLDRFIVSTSYDNVGNRSSLDVSTVPIPKSVIDGKFRNPNASARWHISPSLKNVTWVQAESNMQTFNDGSSKLLTDGITTMTAMVVNVSPQEAAAFKALECGESVVYLVTKNGQLMAYASLDDIENDEVVYGLLIDSISVVSQIVKTDESLSNVTITINFKKSMDIGKVVTINTSDILVDFNTYLEPREAVISVATAPAVTATTATVEVKTNYYGVSGANPVVGLSASDFDLKKAGVAVAVSSATEVSDGEYNLTFASTPSSTLDIVLAGTVNFLSNTANIVTPV